MFGHKSGDVIRGGRGGGGGGGCMHSEETIFRRVRRIAKRNYCLRHVCPSTFPRGSTLLPLNRFSWNLKWIFFENLP